jgi:hypothetical protein
MKHLIKVREGRNYPDERYNKFIKVTIRFKQGAIVGI